MNVDATVVILDSLMDSSMCTVCVIQERILLCALGNQRTVREPQVYIDTSKIPIHILIQ